MASVDLLVLYVIFAAFQHSAHLQPVSARISYNQWPIVIQGYNTATIDRLSYISLGNVHCNSNL